MCLEPCARRHPVAVRRGWVVDTWRSSLESLWYCRARSILAPRSIRRGVIDNLSRRCTSGAAIDSPVLAREKGPPLMARLSFVRDDSSSLTAGLHHDVLEPESPVHWSVLLASPTQPMTSRWNFTRGFRAESLTDEREWLLVEVEIDVCLIVATCSVPSVGLKSESGKGDCAPATSSRRGTAMPLARWQLVFYDIGQQLASPVTDVISVSWEL